jgi:PAS domain S-box-containing protein
MTTREPLRPLYLAAALLAVGAALLIPILMRFRSHVVHQAEAVRVREWESSVSAWGQDLAQELARMEASASRLAGLLTDTIAAAEPGPAATLTAGADGILRSPRSGFDEQRQAGIWVPPYADRSPQAMRMYQAVGEDLALYGRGSVSGVIADTYLVTTDGVNILYMPGNPDYIHDASTETDYRGSGWVQVVSPQRNPFGTAAWTAPIWDPALKAWWIGVSAPVRRDGVVIGGAGHDIIAHGLIQGLHNDRRLFDTHVVILHDGHAFLSNRIQRVLDAAQGRLDPGQIPIEHGGPAIAAHLAGDDPGADWLVRRVELASSRWTAVALRNRQAIVAAVADEWHGLWLLVGGPVAGLCLLAGAGLWYGLRSSRRTIVTLKESEDRMRVFLDQAPEALLVVDPEHDRLVEANPRACALFQYARDHLLNCPPADLSPRLQPDGSSSEPRMRVLLAQAVSGAEPIGIWECRRRDGSAIPCEVRLSSLPWDGRTLVRVCILDHTERRQHEDRLRRNDSLATLGQLVTGLAHDVNNLLTSIRGSAEQIQRREQDPRYRDQATTILHATDQACHLAADLLRLARQDGSRAVSVYDAHTAIQVAASLFHAGDGVRVELTLASPRRMVRGLPAQLQNALLNLLLNARDALPTGGRIVITTARDQLAPGDVPPPYIIAGGWYLRISIADDGAGMPPAVLARCLEPFFTTKGSDGNGLCLPSVHSAVIAHAGAMRLVSSDGAGTTCTLWIPLADDDAAAPA